MVTADSFVAEFESKNENSFRNLLAAYLQGVEKEGFSATDLLRIEAKFVVEATEVAALWLVDSDSLDSKMALGAQCGDAARQYQIIGERLTALGVDLTAFDPRSSGYTKLFAFFRSLQSPEERAAASALTLRGMNVRRMRATAVLCQEKGDPETARLFQEILIADEERHLHAGRKSLLASALAEESQARARRASFRTIEVLAENLDGPTLRKYLARSLKKPTAAPVS